MRYYAIKTYWTYADKSRGCCESTGGTSGTLRRAVQTALRVLRNNRVIEWEHETNEKNCNLHYFSGYSNNAHVCVCVRLVA